MRRSWLAAVIVALVALNLWRWWPADAPSRESAEARRAPMGAHDLRLAVRASSDAALPPVERNIFELRTPAPRVQASPRQARPRPAPAVRQAAQSLPPDPPPKTPEEIEMEAAQAELAQLKLVGVIFRDAKPRAYFAWGDRTYMVSVGEAVARFTVTAITAESARLHDPRTRMDRVIPVLGK